MSGYVLVQQFGGNKLGGAGMPLRDEYYVGGGRALGSWSPDVRIALVMSAPDASAKAANYDIKKFGNGTPNKVIPDPLGRSPHGLDAKGRRAVDQTNYFDSTVATFNLVANPGPEAESMWNSLKSRLRLDHVSDYGSQYLTDGVRLWRYADHWGSFASVVWQISPSPKSESSGLKAVGGKMVLISSYKPGFAIGVVNFSDMRRR